MEWLNYVVWTQVVKSVGFFAVGMICVTVTSFMWGYAKGRKEGFEEGLETARELEEWMNAVAEGIDEVRDGMKQIRAMLATLSSPQFRQP